MPPQSKHGIFENPKKSAYSLEYYDSKWELEHMEELELDSKVRAWTKNHGIGIHYFDTEGKVRTYEPDFLVQYTDSTVEIHEIKASNLLNLPETKKKVEAARKWCADRKMEYRIISKY